MSAKNFSVALKKAKPKKKITNDIRAAIPRAAKSMLESPLIAPLVDSITAAIGFKVKRNLLEDLIIDVG